MASPPSTTAGGREAFEFIYGPPPGNFLETTHGTTHYMLESSGKDGGVPLVVLIHGIDAHLGVFDQLAADLLERGDAVQVLRYDLYDRGYSESNQVEYPIVTPGVHPLDFTLDLHVKQFRDVLEKLELTDQKMILIGHATGGVTSIGYTERQIQNKKNNVTGLVLIDSAGIPIPSYFAAGITDIPVIGPFLAKVFGHDAFMTFVRESLAKPDEMQDYLDKMERNAIINPRFFAAYRSTLSYLKGFGGSSGHNYTAEPEYRRICWAKIPIKLIWGKADVELPYNDTCAVMKKIAEDLGTSVSETSFAGMPHNVFYPDAKPKECSQAICDFVSYFVEEATC